MFKVLVLATLFISNAIAHSSQKFEVLAPQRIQSKLVQSYIDNVILDIYKTIGINATVVYLPESKINERMRAGKFDALFSKIEDKENIPNSIQIKPALVDKYHVYAYTKKGAGPKINIQKMGAIKGVLAHSKAIIKNRARFKSIMYYTNFKKLQSALASGEVDAIMLSNLEFKNEITADFKSGLSKSRQKLVTLKINHYIHKKHNDIAPKLTAEFKKRDQKQELNFEIYKPQ